MSKTDALQPHKSLPTKSRVTVKDIAREMGVSIATVSRAFSNDPNIAQSTQQKVLDQAARMGYSPNLFARGLITQRSKIAALLTSNITNPFYPEVVMKLTRRLHEYGLHTMLFISSDDGEIDKGLPLLQQYNPDVVIVLAATMSSETVKSCVEGQTPVILFNRYVADNQASAICCDNVTGGRVIAMELAAAGHRKLAYISGHDDASTNIDRMQGFLQGCQTAGLDQPKVITGGDFTYEAGYRGMKQLFDGDDPPEAVFCGNDLLAIGAMDAARREFALSLPEDISVIGFDDIAMASWPSHDLTTMAQPVDAMIDRLITEIERRLFADDRSPHQHFEPGHLVVRGSARLKKKSDGRKN